MRIASSFKAIFLLVNHLVAAHVPPVLISPPHRVPGATDVKARNVWQRNVPPKHHPNVDVGNLNLISRQAKESGSCERRARCKKKKIRNPADPSKCLRCPPLTKPDLTRTLCIKDNDVSKEDKKKTLKEKLMEKVKEKMKQFKEKRKERLEKKKPEKTKDWEKKDTTRKNELNNKKQRRMAQCLPLVAVAVGTVAMLELADGGFTEDLLDNIDSEMLELWPKDIDNDWFEKGVPGDLGDVGKEDFVQTYVEVGDAAVGNAVVVASKRAPEQGDDNDDGDAITENDILFEGSETAVDGTSTAIAERQVDKRIVQAIIPLFATIALTIANVAARVARGAGGAAGAAATRASQFFKDKVPKLKKAGESKFSRADQKGKAKEVAKNKNWNRCLKGDKAQK